jgi:hypothetical protein
MYQSAMDRINSLTSSERFNIHSVRFYWPLFGHYVSVSRRDGSATHLLTIEEAHHLLASLINQ